MSLQETNKQKQKQDVAIAVSSPSAQNWVPPHHSPLEGNSGSWVVLRHKRRWWVGMRTGRSVKRQKPGHRSPAGHEGDILNTVRKTAVID